MAIPDSPAWPNILNATIAKYFRDNEINILRERILLAMMESKGRISYNNSGTKYNGRVKYKRGSLTPYADSDILSFSRVDREKQWELPNDRAYVSTEQMGYIDTLQNSGEEAIIKLWDTKVSDMEEDIRENFCDELYVDGYASGNSKRIMGFESAMGADAAVAAPGYVQPSDTYAGLSTVLGTYGGSWSNGTWPEGSGSEEYGFWSPILVDYASPVAGAYSAATKTWQNTCIEAIRNVLTSVRKQKSKKGMADLLLLEETLFKQYKNSQENFKQIPIQSGDALGMRSMGFDVMSQDGATISTEYGMPTNTGYCFNTNHMELKCLQSQLFSSVGPVFDEVTMSYRWAMRFVGNLFFNPKFQGKLKNYAQA